MFERNVELKAEIDNARKTYGIKTWQLAELLGCHEATFYRMMRKELSSSKKQEVLAAIKELKAIKQGELIHD